MRPPRYRFPDEVRTATRAMAARMVREERVVASPAELDAWIAEDHESRAVLENGGYGTSFSADDLYPLLTVFIAEREGAPPPAHAASRAIAPWVIGAVVLAVLILVYFASR